MAFVAPKIKKVSTQRIIFGCGNFFYPRARNSAGLLTVNHMAKVLDLPEWRLKKHMCSWYTAGTDFYLVRPRVYPIIEMPRSLKRTMNFFGIESAKNVTIIHHDPQVPVGHFYATFGNLPPHIEYLKSFLKVLGGNEFHHIGIGVGPMDGEKLYLNHSLQTWIDKPMTNAQLERAYENNKIPDHQMRAMEESVWSEEAIKAMIHTMLNPTENYQSGDATFPVPQVAPDEPTLSQVLGALKMGSHDLYQK
mmetsp:Transcript_29178/g.41060  ORF Transcript_29178/g.41060 Transcript_29178/m.41060 type:complete len:249 (+) Transcript_29178:41-787(+)